MNNQMMTMLQQLKANPRQFLSQQNIELPQNISNSPIDIIQYLLNTKKFNQAQVNNAMQMGKMIIK
jgi:hypothetical protein